MKRSMTVEGVKLRGHWLSGYVADVLPQTALVANSSGFMQTKRFYFRQRGSKWLAYAGIPLLSKVVATAPTLRQVVAMVKQA